MLNTQHVSLVRHRTPHAVSELSRSQVTSAGKSRTHCEVPLEDVRRWKEPDWDSDVTMLTYSDRERKMTDCMADVHLAASPVATDNTSWRVWCLKSVWLA